MLMRKGLEEVFEVMDAFRTLSAERVVVSSGLVAVPRDDLGVDAVGMLHHDGMELFRGQHLADGIAVGDDPAHLPVGEDADGASRTLVVLEGHHIEDGDGESDDLRHGAEGKVRMVREELLLSSKVHELVEVSCGCVVHVSCSPFSWVILSHIRGASRSDGRGC